ncbi:hypothetical protein EYF80_003938 [Liparis tanakae]|uniref:Uncharacterized protein n=1 Tax=Liparis tanakae TaxID=230148 RepID=A0A4Z2J6Y4_9TELE|nr:hypothetical protein EYF80_003938 [Liparis tanakae]
MAEAVYTPGTEKKMQRRVGLPLSATPPVLCALQPSVGLTAMPVQRWVGVLRAIWERSRRILGERGTLGREDGRRRGREDGKTELYFKQLEEGRTGATEKGGKEKHQRKAGGGALWVLAVEQLCETQPYSQVLTSMESESGHALSPLPPRGCHSPSQGDWEQQVLGRFMDGCPPTSEDDWEAEKDRLQTQMGFDTDSELVPCHLIDGGKREIEVGGGRKERGKGRREKAWGDFEVYTCFKIKEEQREEGEGKGPRSPHYLALIHQRGSQAAHHPAITQSPIHASAQCCSRGPSWGTAKAWSLSDDG